MSLLGGSESAVLFPSHALASDVKDRQRKNQEAGLAPHYTSPNLTFLFLGGRDNYLFNEHHKILLRLLRVNKNKMLK